MDVNQKQMTPKKGYLKFIIIGVILLLLISVIPAIIILSRQMTEKPSAEQFVYQTFIEKPCQEFLNSFSPEIRQEMARDLYGGDLGNIAECEEALQYMREDMEYELICKDYLLENIDYDEVDWEFGEGAVYTDAVLCDHDGDRAIMFLNYLDNINGYQITGLAEF